MGLGGSFFSPLFWTFLGLMIPGTFWAWSLALAGFCLAVALDDSGRGLCSRFGVDSPAVNRAAVVRSLL